MGDDIKTDVIKKTQVSLGKYIKKPPLTEKLLKKPPFRFLHDIITNVIRDTGFLDGIFAPEELNHENIKDREAKILFLQKAIDAVKSITGIQLSARPSKIVAGHEPTKTNEFLQAIGNALEKKLDSSEYVAKSSKQEKIGKSKQSKEEVSKIKSKANSQIKTHQRDKSKSRDLSKKKGGSSDRTSKLSKESENEEAKRVDSEVNIAHESNNDEKTYKSEVPKGSLSPNLSIEPNSEPEPIAPKSDPGSPKVLQNLSKQYNEQDSKEEIQQEGNADHTTVSPKKTSPHERKKKSAKISDAQITEVTKDVNVTDSERKETGTPIGIGVFGSKTISSDAIPENSNIPRIASARPRTARPASARPAAPRIRDRGEVVVQEETRVAIGKVNVITDNDSMKEQDEFENFVVEETPLVTNLEQDASAPSDLPAPGDPGQHGHLVAQILETQKELEVDNQFSFGEKEKQLKRVEIEWESGQKREKEIASKEVDRLRTSIQTLTRAANPLGKLMDFLQEDVDAMQRELELWKTTNDQLQVQLLDEQSLTEQSVEPMKIRLQELQHSITEKLNEISALKATILRNDVKIHKLISGGCLQKPDVFG